MRRLVCILVASLSAAVSTQASAACKDPNQPVGAECRKYGESWADSTSSIFQHVAVVGWVSARTLTYPSGPSSVYDGNVESSPLAYHFPASAVGSSTLRNYGGETGIAWMALPYLYIGAAGGYGLGTFGAPAFTTNGLTITPGAGVNIDETIFGGVVGLRLPLGRASVRADALIGGAWMDVDQYAQSAKAQLTAAGSASALYVEPRVHLDVWLTPYFTLGCFAAMPDLSPAATNVGLTLAAHTLPFDGKFSLF